MTNREIASSLGISPATVKRHLENSLRKLRVRNRVEAAIYGLSMTECHVSCHTDCPLAVWRRSRKTAEMGNLRLIGGIIVLLGGQRSCSLEL